MIPNDAAPRVEALNHALRGIPADQVRLHVCWGSHHGPHRDDIPLRDIVGLVLSVPAGCYSIEAANPRHEHEWVVWEDVSLPDGAMLMPGVVGHSTDIIEHPELVAQRHADARLVAGERDRGHRLRPGRAGRPPGDRVGEARGPGGGRPPGLPRTDQPLVIAQRDPITQD